MTFVTQLAALAYADWRTAANDARRVLRSPKRIVLWLSYALLLGLFAWRRARVHGGRGAGGDAALASADYFVCALLVGLAISLATGRGAIGIFRSRVEARFVIGSPVAAPLAIAYLQAREALGQGLRYLFSLVYFLFVFAPREIGLATVLADLALVIGVITAAAAIVVPRRLLSPRAGAVCGVVGIPLGLLALAPALRDAVVALGSPAPIAAPLLALVPAWHPGRVLLEPNPLCVVAVVALAGAATLTLAAAGRDAYPELYTLAVARIERRERLRRRRTGSAMPTIAAPSVIPHAVPDRRWAPRGVLAFVWKSVVEFRRAVRPAYVAGGVALSCATGFAVARLVGAHEELFAILCGVAVNIVSVTGIGATSGFAAELRRPLFWLSPAPVFERLCALAFAGIWRTVVTLEIVASGFALGGGTALETLALAVAFPVLVALLAATGFAVFALFPSPADQRGPVTVLRLGASVLLVAPPAVLLGIGTVGFGTPLPALFAASLLALVEAGGLIGVAAWRLDGQSDKVGA